MLKGNLIHAPILETLGRAGHGSQILIADGNYPASTTLGPHATLVPLNLSPGLCSATQVLEALTSAVPIEAAAVMEPLKTGPYALEEDPPIWSEFRRILGAAGAPDTLDPIERFAFYEAARQPQVCMTVISADQRIYANLLLTIGVIMP